MTIFIAGIHGVGKTYLAKPAADRVGLRYATASHLIREERGHASWDAAKKVDEVADNQSALIKAVARINASGQTLLLDGHLVLRKAVGEHERLPDVVFRDLGCNAIILLTCPVPTVLKRLSARGDVSWSELEIGHFANAEHEHAEMVASALHIPLSILNAPTDDEFDSTLRHLLALDK
ncbi:ATP-binding protein [Xylophilus sp. ASV27]|uniref:ATP-binding protein n=1 Tax=Xylophilus sp. ASV27 TaxID=2795129 RepID=UPI0018ECC1A5|nr:ATP-binding protein [Xylophilus sp. ASV27]